MSEEYKEEGRMTLRYVCEKDLQTATRDHRQPAPKCPRCREDMTPVDPEKFLNPPSKWAKKGLYRK
jgi:hypothetical protein